MFIDLPLSKINYKSPIVSQKPKLNHVDQVNLSVLFPNLPTSHSKIHQKSPCFHHVCYIFLCFLCFSCEILPFSEPGNPAIPHLNRLRALLAPGPTHLQALGKLDDVGWLEMAKRMVGMIMNDEY